jgi:hypothetical protein
VRHLCVCIGSPCLRQRVHGAPSGGGGGAGAAAAEVVTLEQFRAWWWERREPPEVTYGAVARWFWARLAARDAVRQGIPARALGRRA